MAAILLVEDDAPIAETVVYALERAGHDVIWRTTGEAALAVLDERPIDAAVLDVGLPDQTGFEVYRSMRQRHAIPALFLTARNDEVDRIVGFELGADDYVTKPFSPRELTLRVRAILRRHSAGEGPAEAALFHHDPARARIQYDGQALSLTPSEYRLLAHMLVQPNRVFSREQLLAALGPGAENSSDRAVDTLIKQLRGKFRVVRDDLTPIVTHRGFGYSLSTEV